MTSDPSRWRTTSIPLRALISKKIGNLLMAGRCISSAYVAQGALRVIGTSFATGQAAGLAAVETARTEGRSISENQESEVAAKIRSVLETGL
jgi:hypothetical protein